MNPLRQIALATALAGLIAGGIQNRFNTASEVLTPDWNRVNPVEGFKRLFSARSLAPTAISLVKLIFILAMTYSEIRNVLSDPIFTTAVSVGRLVEFLGETCLRIFLRVCFGLLIIAAADYAYQFWRTQRDLMMTKQELKDEAKQSDGDPMIKSRLRQLRMERARKRMMAAVPKATVIVTNPTHYSIALRYEHGSMEAPVLVAKGVDAVAFRIREIATAHDIPIVENPGDSSGCPVMALKILADGYR